MSFAGLGAFAGGLSQGVNQGVNLGRTFRDTRNRRKVEDAISGGLDAARADRDSMIDSKIQPYGDSRAAQHGIDLSQAPEGDAIAQHLQMPSRFKVGDTVHDTREAARSQAERDAPSAIDIFSQRYAPKVQELLMSQGNIEQAEAWGRWAKSKEAERYADNWGKAWHASQMGDFQGMARHLGRNLKEYGYSDVKLSEAQGENGEPMFSITATDRDGNEISRVMSRETLINDGLMMLQPLERFKFLSEQAAAREKAAAEAMSNTNQDVLRSDLRIRENNARSDRALEDRAIHQQQDLAHQNATIRNLEENLRQRGIPEGVVSEAVLRKLAGEITSDHRKGRDPRETAENVEKMLTQNQPGFARLPREEKDRVILEVMESHRRIADQVSGIPSQPPAAGGTQAPPSRGTGGLPMW